MVPIETPLNFAGFGENILPTFAPEFQQMGMTVAGGGAASTMISSKPAPGWQQSLQPGDAVSGVLVTGDMSISAMCTVTYNDRQARAVLRPFVLQPRPGGHADGQGRRHHHAGFAIPAH